MQRRTLGTGGLEVSALGLGCMGMSGLYGPADEDESVATLHHALDAGVNFFDTAMSYGKGHNETLLSRVLSTRRDEAVVATKFGIVAGEYGAVVDCRPERIRSDCEASLRRLGIDHIDLYYQHRTDPHVPIEDSVGAMAELVSAGLVGHLGLSEASAEDLRRASAVHPIAAVQSEWSLWWRRIEDDVVPTARELGVGLVPWGPLGRGFLAGDVANPEGAAVALRASDPRWNGSAGDANRALVAELQSMAEDLGLTMAQLSLRWLLSQGPQVVPIPGMRRSVRVDENAVAAEAMLDATHLARIEAVAGRQAWSGDRVSFGVAHKARQDN